MKASRPRFLFVHTRGEEAYFDKCASILSHVEAGRACAALTGPLRWEMTPPRSLEFGSWCKWLQSGQPFGKKGPSDGTVLRLLLSIWPLIRRCTGAAGLEKKEQSTNERKIIRRRGRLKRTLNVPERFSVLRGPFEGRASDPFCLTIRTLKRINIFLRYVLFSYEEFHSASALVNKRKVKGGGGVFLSFSMCSSFYCLAALDDEV